MYPVDERHADASASRWSRMDEEADKLLVEFMDQRCSQQRNALVHHFAPMAARVGRRIFRSLPADARRTIDREDVEQTAMQQLHMLIERFDTGRGPALGAFLNCRLGHAVIDELRSSGIIQRKDRAGGRYRRTVSLDCEAMKCRRDGLRASTPEPWRQLELRQFRHDAMRVVPRRYRLLVGFRCFRAMHLWQAARRLGITSAQAQNLWDEARIYLANWLGREIEIGQHDPCSLHDAHKSRQCRSPARKPKQPDVGKTRVLVPDHYRRRKEFRRWFVLNLPWVYRRFAAYHHLRGLDLERTAARLSMSLDKAMHLDRRSRKIIDQALQQYSAAA